MLISHQSIQGPCVQSDLLLHMLLQVMKIPHPSKQHIHALHQSIQLAISSLLSIIHHVEELRLGGRFWGRRDDRSRTAPQIAESCSVSSPIPTTTLSGATELEWTTASDWLTGILQGSRRRLEVGRRGVDAEIQRKSAERA